MEQAWRTRCLREEHRLALQPRLEAALQARLQREAHRLELLAQQTEAASPDRLLQKGYSITLKDGKAVTEPAVLQPGDVVTTRVAHGTFKSKII